MTYKKDISIACQHYKYIGLYCISSLIIPAPMGNGLFAVPLRHFTGLCPLHLEENYSQALQ